jgi:anti-sigma factor RsiW
MTPDRDAILTRRYLLGETGDAERERIEQAYFADEAMLERMEAAEETLIEDYLADRLSPDSRNRFEREFLSLPHRRARVATIRALIAAAAGADRAPGRGGFAARKSRAVRWAAPLAAAALVLIAAGVWREVGVSRGGRVKANDAVARSRADASAPLRGSVHTFAVSLLPAGTRSAGTTPDVVVPAGTDLVELRLAAEPGDVPFEHGRAVVRTVSGAEVWSGPVTSPSDRLAGIAASITVPAPRLGPDDYVITLFAVSPQDADREASRYFMRIVAR